MTWRERVSHQAGGEIPGTGALAHLAGGACVELRRSGRLVTVETVLEFLDELTRDDWAPAHPSFDYLRDVPLHSRRLLVDSLRTVLFSLSLDLPFAEELSC